MLIGFDYDMGEESVSASREPVAADKGATAQCSVAVRTFKVAFDIKEEGDDDIGDFSREVWWSGLRCGLRL